MRPQTQTQIWGEDLHHCRDTSRFVRLIDLESLFTYYHIVLLDRPPTGDLHARPRSTAQVYRREVKYLLRILRRFHVSPRDREDLVQEVFVVLCSNAGRFDASRPVRPYLYGIALRLARAHFRKQKRHVVGPVPEVEDPGPGPEETLTAEEVRDLVNSALQTIPAPRRTVLMMRELDEMPLADVSSTLSIPLFTAYARLRKARRELASAVRRRMRTELDPDEPR